MRLHLDIGSGGPLMLVAPTEPTRLKALGRSSSTPEKHGVDIMFATPQGLFGVQRKEILDFLNSVRDGRLAREYPLMQTLTTKVLLIEGRQRWSTEGYLLNVEDRSRQVWTRDQFRSYMLSVQARGIWVVETDDLTDTISWVQNFERWASKSSHTSLLTRPKPQAAWGKPDNHDWLLFLAQSFQQIGVVQAERLINHFGGTLPISWTCTRDELGKTPGIGKTRLDALWNALPPNPRPVPEPVKQPKPTRPKQTRPKKEKAAS